MEMTQIIIIIDFDQVYYFIGKVERLKQVAVSLMLCLDQYTYWLDMVQGFVFVVMINSAVIKKF